MEEASAAFLKKFLRLIRFAIGMFYLLGNGKNAIIRRISKRKGSTFDGRQLIRIRNLIFGLSSSYGVAHCQHHLFYGME